MVKPIRQGGKDMHTYLIFPEADGSYSVHVDRLGSLPGRYTGFNSRDEAERWINAKRTRTYDSAPTAPCGCTGSGPLPNQSGPSTNWLSGRRAPTRYRVRSRRRGLGFQSWPPRRKILKPL
jgi:hypothetical protein